MSNLDPVVQIGDWYYQVVYGLLWPANSPDLTEPGIRLEPRLHSLLNYFLLHPNTLLAKDTLIEKVWPVEEGTDAAVMRAVGALRKVLGDDVRSPSYIATVSKKGYCWLAEIKQVELFSVKLPVEPLSDSKSLPTISSGLAKRPLPWRFIAATAALILLSCASLAFVLAKYTAAPLVRLPDTITPISALSGQEYWPLLNAEHSHVVYQHKAPDQSLLQWSVQNLSDLKVEYLPQLYRQLSAAVWQSEQDILFRAATASEACAFYRQQLWPKAEHAQLLWPCNRVLPQALVRWQQQWLWADTESASNDMLIMAATEGQEATQLLRFSAPWRALNAMLADGDNLFFLAQRSFSSSGIYHLTLPDGQLELIKSLPYKVAQFSWWSRSQLLLSPVGAELEIYDLNSNEQQRLGALTRELAQAVKSPGQVLATQYLDYTTDIYNVNPNSDLQAALSTSPWHVSNRSERLLAVSSQGAAFVSERSGHAQVWLTQGRDSAQLSRFNELQQVQQLLWHNDNLLVLVNNQLFSLDQNSAALTPYPIPHEVPGRFASCNNVLYWTALTEHGWQLFREQDTNKQTRHQDVVDVRCGPDNSLLLQFANQPSLGLLQDSVLTTLSLILDWRDIEPEQWFTDEQGVYWLDKATHSLMSYYWQNAKLESQVWPEQTLPLAIYRQDDGNGLGYVVRQRPYDTDIVWLKNRR